MRTALAPIAARYRARVVEVDLDGRPDWEARMGERVPLLLLGDAPDGRELAALTLDPDAVEAALGGATVARQSEIR